MPERLMRIGELAERTGMSLPMLRHYDETGLLSPSARTAGNFRLYSERDYERLMVIRRMKPLGFSVEQMREVLIIVDGLRRRPLLPETQRAELLDALRTFTADACARRAKLQVQLARADEFIAILQHEAEVSQLTSVPAESTPAKSGAGGRTPTPRTGRLQRNLPA